MNILLRFMLVLYPGLKPVCIYGIRSLLLTYKLNLNNIKASTIFPPTGRREMGLYEAGSLDGLSFFSMGTMTACFQVFGKIPVKYISLAMSKNLWFPP